MAKIIIESPDDLKRDFLAAVGWKRTTQKEVVLNAVCKYIKDVKKEQLDEKTNKINKGR